MILELLSKVQYEARVCRKLCDNFKILKNVIEDRLFESIVCAFCRGTGFITCFKLKKAVWHTFFFFFLHHWRKKNTSGMSSSSRYQVCLLGANFWVILSKKWFSTSFGIFLGGKLLSPKLWQLASSEKKKFVSASKPVKHDVTKHIQRSTFQYLERF